MLLDHFRQKLALNNKNEHLKLPNNILQFMQKYDSVHKWFLITQTRHGRDG
jgi:hypothetical protein